MTMRVLGVMMLLLITVPAAAQPLHYWGPLSTDTATGVIEAGSEVYSVRVGDVIPGHGTVRAVSDEEVVLVYTLSEAEKLDLSNRGQAVIDARQVHIRNVHRLLPQPERVR
jgi:hypothetical protein